MNTFANVSGTYRRVNNIYANNSGSWVSVRNAWKNVSGTWKQIFAKTSSFIQLGADIDGQASSDNSGYSVSMNAAGDRVAIGAYYNSNVNGANAGNVRIFSWNGTAWTQLGTDIYGESESDFSGWSVSMNDAGNRVAIGAISNEGPGTPVGSFGHVRVHSWNGTSWVQLGQDIDGETVGDQSGYSVSMNAAGDRVAIGAIYNTSLGRAYAGQTRIYSLVGTTWIQLGQDIDGEAANDESGWSVSMNAAGDRIAIGARKNASGRGHVRVYSLIGTIWIQMGIDIDGEAASDYSGFSVSMNDVGDRVAIGAIFNSGNGSSSGHTRVYSWNGAAWIKLGQDMDGEAAVDNSGYSVSMNAVGDRVAIGAPYNDGNGGGSGHVRVYSLSGTNWVRLSSDIDGESALDQSGWSVSMNAVGDRIAIGAYLNDNVNGTNSGHTRVYSCIESVSLQQLGQDLDGEAIGDRRGKGISMNAAGDRVAIGDFQNNGNGTDSGQTCVYSLSTGNLSATWVKLGQNIYGDAAFDQSGYSVSMNAVGDRVAIGAYLNDGNGTESGLTRIYSLSAGNLSVTWVKLGQDIYGETANDISGWSVSMNAVGDRVAIGAPNNDGNDSVSGSTRVYSLSTGNLSATWVQLGQDIDGEAANNWSGYSVSMNAVGDRVAIGAPYNDGNGTSSGHTRVYSLSAGNLSATWVKLGQDIDGDAANDNSGYSVSMNAVGDRVAIGAYLNDGNGTSSGHARVYSLSAGNLSATWVQLGLDIDGEAAGDQSGYSVSMNAVGDRVAIGAIYNDGNVINSDIGQTRIYSWNGESWIKLYLDIDGETAGDSSGIQVSMNAAGDRVAIGSTNNDGNGINAGHVRVYSLAPKI